MICYNDITFCSYYKYCKLGGTCFRAKNNSVITNAIKSDLPICEFTEKPDCFIEGDVNEI